MKIVTYNFQTGGRGRQHWSHIDQAFAPDILLAQESYDPATCNVPAGQVNQTVWRRAGARHWGTAVYAKAGKLTALNLPAVPAWLPGWLVGVEVEGLAGMAGRRLRVFSVHTPPRSVSKLGYPQTVEKILDVIAGSPDDGDLIIGGDFNLLSLGQRHPSETRHGKPWRTTRRETAILNRLQNDFELVNCWQTANPGVPLAQTLRTRRNPTAAYHCDGIFVPAAWTVTNCDVGWSGGGKAQAAHSDHFPVVATVKPSS